MTSAESNQMDSPCHPAAESVTICNIIPANLIPCISIQEVAQTGLNTQILSSTKNLPNVGI